MLSKTSSKQSVDDQVYDEAAQQALRLNSESVVEQEVARSVEPETYPALRRVQVAVRVGTGSATKLKVAF